MTGDRRTAALIAALVAVWVAALWSAPAPGGGSRPGTRTSQPVGTAHVATLLADHAVWAAPDEAACDEDPDERDEGGAEATAGEVDALPRCRRHQIAPPLLRRPGLCRCLRRARGPPALL